MKEITNTHYVCECCGWEFDSAEACAQHERGHRTCYMCGTEFATLDDLRAHVVQHIAPQPSVGLPTDSVVWHRDSSYPAELRVPMSDGHIVSYIPRVEEVAVDGERKR